MSKIRSSTDIRRDVSALAYRVRRTRRRTLGVYVFPDGRVEARVPIDCPEGLVERFVRSKEEWIRRQQERFAGLPRALAPDYRDGAAHPYLGRSYRLRLQRARAVRGWLVDDRLHLNVPSASDATRIAQRLKTWYRHQAEGVFAARLEAMHPTVPGLKTALPALRFRWMRSRWGSCARNGVITLNLELIKYPVACIDYVLVHELCHLLEFNHGRGFYRLMDAAMPDWREYRLRLRHPPTVEEPAESAV